MVSSACLAVLAFSLPFIINVELFYHQMFIELVMYLSRDIKLFIFCGCVKHCTGFVLRRVAERVDDVELGRAWNWVRAFVTGY